MNILVCPKCGANIDDNCESCFNCGMQFKHVVSNNSSEISNKKEKEKESLPHKIKKIDRKKLIRIMVIAIIFIIVVIVGVIIITYTLNSNGKKTADKLSSKIGEDISVAMEYADIYMNKSSKSEAINKQGDFDYVYESDKIISVDGVKVPKWLIKVQLTENDVFSVYYRDYSSQDKYYKGDKLKNQIDINEIEENMAEKNVSKIMDIDPISILRESDTSTIDDDDIITEKIYMYYFINDDKDEEHMEIIVTFDNDMNVTDVEEINLSKNNKIIS